jgi:uncharacterized lipoprotein YmbA
MKRLVIAAALLTGACSLVGGGSKETFYVLSGPQTPAPAARPGAPVIAVGPVAVPEAVDRAPMVLASSPNHVDLNEEHRWAEPLKTAIPRIVGEHLMRLLDTQRVMTSRLGSGSPDIDYRVALEVQRFDSSLTQGAAIDVLWTITGKRATPARSGRSSVREPAAEATPEGVAAAHSRALARVAADIAAAMR